MLPTWLARAHPSLWEEMSYTSNSTIRRQMLETSLAKTILSRRLMRLMMWRIMMNMMMKMKEAKRSKGMSFLLRLITMMVVHRPKSLQ